MARFHSNTRRGCVAISHTCVLVKLKYCYIVIFYQNRNVSIIIKFKLFLANVPIDFIPPENTRKPKGYKMGTLARNGLTEVHPKKNSPEFVA